MNTMPASTVERSPDPAESASRRRGNTRDQLIHAGRRLFFAGQLPATSVGQIAKAAGFTRAAFYLHFADKDDLIAAIMHKEADRPVEIFRWFETRPRDAVSIERFVRRYIEATRHFQVNQFYVAALNSAAARAAFRANRLRFMRVLGTTFPAFRPAANDSAAERERVARATAALVLLEQLGTLELAMAEPAEGEALILHTTTVLLELDAAYPG